MVSVHDQVGQSVTIATRYAAVRRQGARDEQILDYQSHYSVLLPIIAGIYAVHFLRR
jgi:acyl-CoA oxidase